MREQTRFDRLLGRLLLGTQLASFGAALLAVFEAPLTVLWKLAIGVTEWGHLLSASALLSLLGRRALRRPGRPLLSALTALLAASPLGRAALVARRLPRELEASFGPASPRSLPGAPARPAPLSPRQLLRGVPVAPITPETYAYAQRQDGPLELDLYRPAGGSLPAPCVLVIHGGGWQHYNKLQLPSLNSYLAARGYAVAAINYRLAPAHRYPCAYEDVLAALDYLKANAQQFGIDPMRLALLGRSAGGHLALLAAYTRPDPAIRGVVSLYGPTDLQHGWLHPSRRLVYDSRGVLESFLGGPPRAIPAIYQQASPACQASAGAPPTLLIHGGRDELVRPIQSEIMAARLAQLGVPHYYLRLPWATHGADYNFSGPSGQLSTYAVERFLAATLGEI